MADLSRIVSVIFQGEDELSSTMRQLSRNMEDLGQGVADVAEPLANVANVLLGVEAAMVAVGVAALKMNAETEDATAKIQAQLGITKDQAEDLGDVAREVFANNFGESVEEAADAVSLAFQKMGDVSDDELQRITENAFLLQKAFGVDFNETITSANSLMRNFGLSSIEAFDFIAAGLQQGLNSSGDFLDSISEYAPQFSNAGADASALFSIMQTGLADGVLGTDKAADAFKEFRVRIQDGSTATSDALAQIGLDADQMARDLGNGSISASEAFNLVIEKLNAVDNENTRIQAGVGLLGTQFEDLGQSGALALSTTATSLDDLAGSVEKVGVINTTLTSEFQEAWRRVTSEVANLPLFDELSDKLKDFLTAISEGFPEALNQVDFSKLEASIAGLEDLAQDIFGDIFGDVDITTPEGLATIIQKLIDGIKSLNITVEGIIDSWRPFIQLLSKTIDYLINLDDETKKFAGEILGTAQQITLILAGVAGVGAVFGGVTTTFSAISAGASTLAGGLGSLSTALGGASGAAATLAGPTALVALSGAVGAGAGTLINEYVPGVKDATQGMFQFIDSIVDFTGTKGGEKLQETAQAADEAYQRMLEARKGIEGVTEASKEIVTPLTELKKRLLDVPEDITIGFNIDDLAGNLDGLYDNLFKFDEQIAKLNAQKLEIQMAINAGGGEDLLVKINEIDSQIANLTDAKNEINVGILLETTPEEVSDELFGGLSEDAKRVAGDIGAVMIDGVRSFSNVDFGFSEDSVKKAKEDIEEISPEKKLEIEVELKKAELEQDAETLRTQIEQYGETYRKALEVEASIDIAKLEADAKKIEAIAGTIQTGFESAAAVIGDALGGYTDAGRWEQLFLEKVVEEQLNLQQLQVDQQDKLLEQQDRQIDLEQQKLDLKKLLLEGGGGLMTFQLDPGINPALEEVLRKMVEYVQVWATDEGLEALIQA